MKRDMTENSQGGPKKFLYTEPRGRNSQFNDDEFEQQEWAFETQNNRKNKAEFDLDDVWSIKKNVSAAQTPNMTPRPGADNFNLNVNKNYYSRHNGLESDEFSIPQNTSPRYGNTEGTVSWQQAKPRHYSYSNAPTQPGHDPSGVESRLTMGSPRQQQGGSGHPSLQMGGVPGRGQLGGMGVQTGGRVSNNPRTGGRMHAGVQSTGMPTNSTSRYFQQ